MEILIITGLSGGGKSRAASFLEDMGYYIVDNLPAEMIEKFADFCAVSGGHYDRIALVYDVRAGEPVEVLIGVIENLKLSGKDCKMLYLEASTQSIISRYKESRRTHPLLGKSDSLEQAIENERQLMRPVRDHADYVLNTTSFPVGRLRNELAALFNQQGIKGGLSVNILSFGFKYGVPMECDLVFDVRFLPNPFYIPELKEQTGLDAAVNDFIFSFSQTHEFMDQLQKMITFLLPYYSEEGKTVLVIGIGCTGGRHRSVAMAHLLAAQIAKEGYQVSENHRDITRG
jgi:UPF0042 nucleotide-binding protein